MNFQHPTPPLNAEALLEELRGLHPSRACPRWAVLGPRYSGKTQFLQQFVELCRSGSDGRSPLPLYLDLRKVPLDAEDRMYRSVFQQLDLACRDLPFDVSAEGPPDGTGRFDHLIKDVLVKCQSRLALVVDHLDAVPQFFGRSLLRRFRLMVDQEGLYREFKNLCLLLAGSTSLFDLRRTGDSTFVVSSLIFPRPNESAWRSRVGSNGCVAETVHAKIRAETGGETMYLDLLFDALDPTLPLSEDLIERAVESLLDSRELPDAFHQIVLEIASDRELRSLVRDIASAPGRRVIRRDASPDIDRFCLSGVLVLRKEQSFAHYCFRNGIVGRFVRRLLEDEPTGYVRFPSVALLADVRTECYQSPEVYGTLKKLLSAWSTCVFHVQAPVAALLHVTYCGQKEVVWIDPAQRKALRASAMDAAPHPSVLHALKLAHETSPPHAAFGFDEQRFSFAIPFARPEASLDLVLTFPREAADGLNENALSHWLRLLDDCWPSLAAAALCELSAHFVRHLSGSVVPARKAPDEQETRIHWAPPFGIILDKPGECKHHLIERQPQQIERTVDDLNQRCLRMMMPGRTAADFGGELRGVASQLESFLESCPNLTPQLQIAGGDFVFISEESGLKLPIELLPVHSSYLALESRIARRIRNITPPATRRSFEACIRDLIEQGGTLKVLLAGADPRNSLPNLDGELRQLKDRIEVACDSIGLRSRISVVEPIEATLPAVGKSLEKSGPFHLFHFCGHGEQGLNPDESSLVLRGKHGEDDRVSCEKLRFMLHNHVLWLAYLSCCYGAAVHGSTGLDQQYVGTIQAVLAASVPNVVGFRWAVTDMGAYALALSFYEHLFSSERIFNPSDALWKARRSVAGDDDKRDAWASVLLVSQCG